MYHQLSQLMKEEKFAELLQGCKNTLEIDKNNPRVLNMKILAEWRLGISAPKKVIADFQRIANIHVWYAAPFYNIAQCYREKGKGSLYKKYLLMALEREPSSLHGRECLVHCYVEEGDYCRAMEQCKIMLSMWPSARIHAMVAYVAELNKDIAVQIEYLEKSFALDPSSPSVAIELALAYAKLKNLPKVLEICRASLPFAPDDIHLNLILVGAMYNLKEYDGIVVICDRLLIKYSNESDPAKCSKLDKIKTIRDEYDASRGGWPGNFIITIVK